MYAIQGEHKKYSNTKMISQKYVNIFVLNFVPLFRDICAKVCCFVLYLLDACQIDGNAKFKNEFCNRTDWVIQIKIPQHENHDICVV